jgi:Homoserine trans-succinylase
VEHLPFEDVDYWQELLEIMTFAQSRVYSTLYICWAAQAALYHFYGIPKYTLPSKLSGIFDHNILQPGCRLFRGFDDTFTAPHSRHTEVRVQDVSNQPALRVLAQSPEAGLALAESLDHSQVFMTGHLEYDRDTLDAEFRRDLERGMGVPFTYAHGSIRLSLSRYSTQEEVDFVIENFPDVIKTLRMLDAVVLFSTFGIVETVKRSHKVTSDAAGAFKTHILPNQFLCGFGFRKQTRLHQHVLSPCSKQKMVKKMYVTASPTWGCAGIFCAIVQAVRRLRPRLPCARNGGRLR